MWTVENIIVGIIIILTLMYFAVVAHKTYKGNRKFFQILVSDFKKHSFLLVLLIPTVTAVLLINYEFEPGFETFLKTLCYSVVGVGIFSGTLKYINSLVFVRKQFEDIITSQKFDKIINDKFKAFVFSDSFLASISEDDLKKKWKKLTYFKYESKFPILWEKLNLKEKISNYYFKNDSLKYYYKGFNVQINIDLLPNDILKITEISDFTIVSNSTDEMNFSFWVSSIEEDSDEDEIYTKIDEELTVIDGEKVSDLNEKKKFDDIRNMHRKTMEIPLKGKNEYQVEKVIYMTQHYDLDRIYSFTSGKIMDDLYIHIQYSKKLKVYFYGLNENSFKPDNRILSGEAYKNKDIIMPGEIFNIFIDKV